VGEPTARIDLWRLAGKTSRAFIAASRAASREYRLAQQSRVQTEHAEAATQPQSSNTSVRNAARAGATRCLWLGFQAALPATLIAFLNPGSLFGHANWIEWLTIACGATLLPMGVLLASNWHGARDSLTQQLHKGPQELRSTRRTWTSRIINPALQLVGVAWIPLGILSLIRGSSNLH